MFRDKSVVSGKKSKSRRDYKITRAAIACVEMMETRMMLSASAFPIPNSGHGGITPADGVITATAPTAQTSVEGQNNLFIIGHVVYTGTDDYSTDENWGDGTPDSTGSSSGPDDTDWISSHTYTEEGTYTATFTATEHETEVPGIAPAETTDIPSSVTYTITVTDPAVVPAVGPDFPLTLTEGQSTGFIEFASFTDPGGPLESTSDYSATINFGDEVVGTSEGNPVIQDNGDGTYGVYADYTYEDEDGSPFTVTTTVHHDAAPDASVSSTVTVLDAPIVGSPASQLPVFVEGLTNTLPVASFEDEYPQQFILANGVTKNIIPIGPPASEPDGPADFTATITWGDGNVSAGTITQSLTDPNNYTVTGTNTFAEEGLYKVSVHIADDGGSTTDVTEQALVIDAPLAATGNDFTGVEGQFLSGQVVASFTDADPNGMVGDYLANIDWGDGTSGVGIIQANGTDMNNDPIFNVLGNHTYHEEGNYTATIAIQDAGSGTFATDAVTVSDPSVVGVGTTNTGIEAQSLSVTLATFTDPGGAEPNKYDPDPNIYDHYTADIDWGDTNTDTIDSSGNPDGSIVYNAATHTFSLLGTHTYSEESDPGAPYQVTVTLHHEEADDDVVTTSITVLDPSVVATGGFAFSPVEGQDTGPIVVATFTDPGGAETTDDYAPVINWGDGTPTDFTGTIQVDPGGGGVFDVVGDHTYTEESSAGHPSSNPYKITVSVLHGDNQVVDGGFEVPGGPTIPGWTLAPGTGGGVFETTNFNTPFEGAQFLELNSNAPSTISQTIPTIAGQKYQFSFAFSARPGTGTSDNDMQVSVNGTPISTVTADGTFLGDTSWTVHTFTVTATGTSTTLQFASLSPAGDTVGGLLDGVTFTALSNTVTDTAIVSDPAVIGAPTDQVTGVEGFSTGSVAVATFTDPGGFEALSDYSATINWGDGSSSNATLSFDGVDTVTVKGNHVYKEESDPANPSHDPYQLTITIHHEKAPVTVVDNTAFISDPAVIGSGVAAISAKKGVSIGTTTLATFVDPGGTEAASDYSATITWGDGSSPVNGTIVLSGGKLSVTGSHTFNSTGTFHPTIVIHHETANNSNTVTDTVNVAGNVLTPSGNNSTGLEGRSVAAKVASFTTTNSAAVIGNFTASINWGDGNTSAGTIVKDSTGHFHVNGTHTYHEESTGSGYVVTTTIKETGGSTVVATSLSKIADAPIDSATGLSLSKSVNVSFTNLVLGSFRDQDATNTTPQDYVGTITWGDGTTSAAGFVFTGATVNVGSFWHVTGSHKYTAKKTYAVKIVLDDKGNPGLKLTINTTIKVS